VKIPRQDEDEVAAIVRDGEKRARFGQTNNRDTLSPFKKLRHFKTRHRLTRAVAEYLPRFEIDKFHAMSDQNEWWRLEYIRKLALSQIKDDGGLWIYAQLKIGQQRVDVIEIWEDDLPDQELPPRTRVQNALSEAMDTLISKLSEAQQHTIKLRYYENMSIRDTAKARHVMEETIRYLEAKAKRNLIRYFVEEGWLRESDAAEMGVTMMRSIQDSAGVDHISTS